MATFPDRLKELRKSKGVTQKAIAEYLGIQETSYQHYEYGKREPNHETTIKLADFYDVSIDYILGLTEIPNKLESILTKEELDKLESDKNVKINNTAAREIIKKKLQLSTDNSLISAPEKE